MGTQLSSPKRGQHSPQFLAQVYCGQTAGWIKMPLGTEAGLSAGDIVLDRDPAPPKGHSPQFSAHVYCGHTAACIRIPLCNINSFTLSSSLTSLRLFVFFSFHQFSVFSSRSTIIAHHAIYSHPSVALHYLPHHVFYVPYFLHPCREITPGR